MFWRKKSSSSSDRPVSTFQTQPSEPPKPILRMNTEGQGISSIRFAGGPSNTSGQAQASSPVKPTFPIRANTSPATYGSGQAPNQHGEMSTERVRSHTQPPAPRVIVSSYDSYSPPTVQPHQRMASYDSSPLSSQPKMVSSRRSSRPTSPGTSSFGARIRSRTEPIPSPTFNRSPSPAHSSPLNEAGPLETPPMPSSHVTTPPTAYVSSFQSRAPPPPSPYRPTNERRRSSLTRNLPENLPKMNDFAPSIHVEESLLASDSRSSVFTLPPGPDVPMLNIIPATPQNQGEEFSAIWEQHYPSASSSSTTTGLEEAVKLEEISLEQNVTLEEVEQEISDAPSIDVQLDFSPFSPLAELPDTDDTPLEEIREYITAEDLERFDYQEQQGDEEIVEEDGEEEYFGEEHDAPSEPLPPSPPFMSYPSLPSLSSHSHDGEHDNDNDHGSIRSSLSGSGSESDCSIQTSSSMSSLVSFPDVEEALGSMLASLSDSSMASTAINTPTKDQSVNSVYQVNVNHGLGLGLGMNDSQSSITSSTAPLALSPRRRAPPPPLDLTGMKSKNRRSISKRESMIHSAPIINHRVAFYGTAKVHPNSPCSGIFTGSSSSSSSLASSGSSSSTISLNQQQITPSSYHHRSHSYRDSMSLASEASDEDLCTASIISLTPVMQGKVAGREMKEEIMVERDGENVLGLGLGLEFGMMGGGQGEFGRSAMGVEQQEEENVEVGLAL